MSNLWTKLFVAALFSNKIRMFTLASGELAFQIQWWLLKEFQIFPTSLGKHPKYVLVLVLVMCWYWYPHWCWYCGWFWNSYWHWCWHWYWHWCWLWQHQPAFCSIRYHLWHLWTSGSIWQHLAAPGSIKHPPASGIVRQHLAASGSIWQAISGLAHKAMRPSES